MTEGSASPRARTGGTAAAAAAAPGLGWPLPAPLLPPLGARDADGVASVGLGWPDDDAKEERP